MKKLLLLLEHKIVKIGLIIVIVLVGFFLFYEQDIKEKAVNVSQGKFPISSYLFQAYEGIKNKIDTINQVKPNDETKSVNENIEKTQKDLNDFNALVQELPNLPKDFNKTLIKPQSPSFNYNTANKEEKTRLVILASRISSQKETQPPISIKNSVSYIKSKEKRELEKEYGSSGFKNFKRKNIASSENKLLRTITADRMIPAILITPISSEIGGSKIVAQVESDIYATMGRAVLIPKGSRAIGYYNSNNKIGEYRLEIAWNRIITPQGVNIILSDSKGADVKGYNGMIGTLQMNGVSISPYKKSTHCQRTHLDNKSLKEIALDMNPKLEKQSPFIDANKLAMQSAGLLRKNKDVLIAFATDICMERNEHKKEEFISLKESCTQSQTKLYNNKERFEKFIQDYQKDLKTCLLDTSNTKEEMEQNVSQCQKEQLRDNNKGFTLEELVQKYAK